MNAWASWAIFIMVSWSLLALAYVISLEQPIIWLTIELGFYIWVVENDRRLTRIITQIYERIVIVFNGTSTAPSNNICSYWLDRREMLEEEIFSPAQPKASSPSSIPPELVVMMALVVAQSMMMAQLAIKASVVSEMGHNQRYHHPPSLTSLSSPLSLTSPLALLSPSPPALTRGSPLYSLPPPELL